MQILWFRWECARPAARVDNTDPRRFYIISKDPRRFYIISHVYWNYAWVSATVFIGRNNHFDHAAKGFFFVHAHDGLQWVINLLGNGKRQRFATIIALQKRTTHISARRTCTYQTKNDEPLGHSDFTWNFLFNFGKTETRFTPVAGLFLTQLRLLRLPNNGDSGYGVNLGVSSIVAVIALRDSAGMRYGHDRVIPNGSHCCPLERQKSANQRSSSCSAPIQRSPGRDAEPV